MKTMSTIEQNISPDSWIKIFSYLLASDAIRLVSCSKYLSQRVGENEFVWRELLTWGDAQLLRQVVNQSLSFKHVADAPIVELKSEDEVTKSIYSERSKSVCHELKAAARSLEGASDLSTLSWDLLQYDQNTERIEGMEAHAAVTVLDRFVVIIGGWGASSLNEAYVLDGAALPSIVRIPTETLRNPRFKYGFSATLLSMPDTSPLTQTDFKGMPGGAAPSKALKGPSSAKFQTKSESGELVQSSRRIIVFGGCTSGGYAGDCSDMYYLDIDFFVKDVEENPVKEKTHSKSKSTAAASLSYVEMDQEGGESSSSNERFKDGVEIKTDEEIIRIPVSTSKGQNGKKLKIYATYSKVPIMNIKSTANSPPARDTSGDWEFRPHSANVTGGTNAAAELPSTRGYHTANIVTLNGRHSLVVWGGLHHRAPTTRLEVFDLENNVWRAEPSQGTEPSRRFGHSAILVKSTDTKEQRLVVTGGSDGNDLIRNGRDHKDVYILTILAGTSRILKSGQSVTAEDIFVWSTPQITSVSKGYPHTLLLPGRCHSSALIGDNILYFGGGANNSNGVSVLRIGSSSYGHSVIADETSSSKSDELETSHSPDSKKRKKGINDEGDLKVTILKPTFVQPEGYERPEKKSSKKTKTEIKENLAGAKSKDENGDENENETKNDGNDDDHDDDDNGNDNNGKGGSAKVFRIESQEKDKEKEKEIFLRPCPLVSTAAVHVGRYFLIFGGFNNKRRERAEIWLLDLAASTSLAARRSAASYRGPNSSMEHTALLNDVEPVGIMLPIESTEDRGSNSWGYYRTGGNWRDQNDDDDEDENAGGDDTDGDFAHFMRILRRKLSRQQLMALGILRADDQEDDDENENEDEEEDDDEEGEGEEGDDDENEENEDDQYEALEEEEEEEEEEYAQVEVELDEPDSEAVNMTEDEEDKEENEDEGVAVKK